MPIIIIISSDDADDNNDEEEKKERKTCYHLDTGYRKATNDMETVISIDNRVGKTANVHGEIPFWLKKKR